MFRQAIFIFKKLENNGIYNIYTRRILREISPKNTICRLSYHTVPLPRGRSSTPIFAALLGASVFTWLGFEPKHNSEDDLVLMIRRSILMIQNKDYSKAEQLLHLALRIAQQTQNEKGITYIYDVMANLAFQKGELEKAEKLFIAVMQRLITNGVSQEDIKNIHISLKLAKICHLKGDSEKASIGFRWCLKHLDGYIRSGDNSEDTKSLLGLAKDWYGHVLMENKNQYREAIELLLESYEIASNNKDSKTEEIVILLNDIATVFEQLMEYKKAEEYLLKAVAIGKSLSQMEDLGTIYINLGRIYFKQSLYTKARKSCGYGWRLCFDRKNEECKAEAKKCIHEVENL